MPGRVAAQPSYLPSSFQRAPRTLRGSYGAGMRVVPTLVALALAGATAVVGGPAEAATTYKVKVTCTVPKNQPERQLAPNSCLNYLPDGTQTFVAKVVNGSGKAVPGVQVKWSDNASNAAFRAASNPCTTGSNGTCGDELVVTRPKLSQKVTVTATVGGASANGYLSFAVAP